MPCGSGRGRVSTPPPLSIPLSLHSFLSSSLLSFCLVFFSRPLTALLFKMNKLSTSYSPFYLWFCLPWLFFFVYFISLCLSVVLWNVGWMWHSCTPNNTVFVQCWSLTYRGLDKCPQVRSIPLVLPRLSLVFIVYYFLTIRFIPKAATAN